jgi:hypothetical protein
MNRSRACLSRFSAWWAARTRLKRIGCSRRSRAPIVCTGLIHVTSGDIAGVFPIGSPRASASVGVGTWLRMTGRLGARAEARFIRSVSKASSSGFETWRTTAGVSVRF